MRPIQLRSLVSSLLLASTLVLFLATRADAGPGRWTPFGPGGGTVFGLAVDPSSPNTLWAASNGLYKSMDRGETWSWKAAGGFQSVAVDPDHPSIVYASGNEVLRSEDGGETWRSVLRAPSGLYARGIAVAPGSGTVYVAADGLRRSTDGGRTWQTFLDSYVSQVVVDPTSPRTVYAVGDSIYNDGLWKSVDGGDTWVQIGAPELMDVRAMALAPSRPGTLYAATGEAIYRSTDGGATWQQTAGTPILIPTTLAVDPDSPSTVYLGGSHGIAVSTDGGATWTRQEDGLPGHEIVQIQTLVFGTGTPRLLYTSMWDFGVARKRPRESRWRFGLQLGLSEGSRLLEIDPVRPGTVYVSAAPGRTFRTTDGGHTWTPFATALGNRQVEDVAVDRFHPATLYAAMEEGVFRSEDDGATWTQIDTVTSKLLALADRGNTILSAGGCGLRRSGDGGLTWQEVISCEAGEDLTVRVLELITLPGRPAVYAVVFAGNGGSTQGVNLYTSRSSGARWGEGIGANDVAVSLAHPATVYTVAYSYYGSHRSDDGGRHWTDLNINDALSVAVDPRNPEIVYIAGRTVRRSTDGGKTWNDADAGLVEQGHGIVELFTDPTTPGHLFAQATLGGLFEATFPSP